MKKNISQTRTITLDDGRQVEGEIQFLSIRYIKPRLLQRILQQSAKKRGLESEYFKPGNMGGRRYRLDFWGANTRWLETLKVRYADEELIVNYKLHLSPDDPLYGKCFVERYNEPLERPYQRELIIDDSMEEDM